MMCAAFGPQEGYSEIKTALTEHGRRSKRLAGRPLLTNARRGGRRKRTIDSWDTETMVDSTFFTTMCPRVPSLRCGSPVVFLNRLGWAYSLADRAIRIWQNTCSSAAHEMLSFFTRKDGESRSQIRNCHYARALGSQHYTRDGSPQTARGVGPGCHALHDWRDSALSVDRHGSFVGISKTARPGPLGTLHGGFLGL